MVSPSKTRRFQNQPAGPELILPMKITFLRVAGAVISGALVYSSYEPLGWSWAGIVGMVLFLACLLPQPPNHVSAKLGVLLGITHFLTLYLLLLPCCLLYTSPSPRD